MVEYINTLNAVFSCLSDPTRRDILKRVGKKSMNVGEIANQYKLTFAAVAKHIEILKRSQLVTKKRKGKEQVVSINPKSFTLASDYLQQYQQLWKDRLDSLDNYLKKINKQKINKERTKYATNKRSHF
jgi:DNA-binding transcriptional ArsR family regulator